MVFGFLKKKKKSSQFKSLIVKEVIQETDDAVSIVFEEPKEGKVDYKPGQFLTLIQTINKEEVRRAYSLSSCKALGENPTVTIKRVKEGLMSNHIGDHIKAGDQIDILDPMGNFTIDITPKENQHVYLFGGGSGITPLISIAKTILTSQSNSKVSLIYANRDDKSIIFKDVIDKLNEQYTGRFSVVHFLENATSSWTGHTGYFTEDALTKLISEKSDSNYSNVEYMTCGPEPMMKIVMDTLNKLDIPEERKHKESFVAAAPEPATQSSNDISDQQVKIVLEGEEHEFLVPKDKSILEAGLDDGLDIPFSCQSGLCTACRAKCVEGAVDMNGVDTLSKEEKEDGYVLLCVSHPTTKDVKVEVG